MRNFLKNKKNNIILLILIFLSLPSIFALFHSGFFKSDDGEWMIIRFSAFYQALTDGQFPVRFLGRLNFGYGYPVSNFLYPGFMYLSLPIHILGFDFQNTIKIMFGLSMIFSAVFTFFWLSKLFNKSASFFGALFYLYAPYHLFDFYKRGSMGEILAFAVVPFIFWQAERRSFFFTTLGIALLILSHNTLAALFLPLIILYFLLDFSVSKKDTKLAYYHFFSLFIGLLLTSFFSIPSILELNNTIFSHTKISDFQKYFADINLIGIPTIIVFCVALGLFISRKAEVSKHRLTILFLFLGLSSIFFALPISLSFWNILPVSFIQFPFRLLSITVLCSSFLLAFILSTISKNSRVIGVAFLVITFFSSSQYLIPQEFSNFPDSYYFTNEATTTVHDEYMPKWVEEKPLKHFAEKVEVLKGESKISNLIYNSKRIEFEAESNSAAVFRVNTIYYPGWEVFVNGKKRSLFYNNSKGVIDIEMSSGKNKVSLIFKETPFRLFADIISLISIFVLGTISIKWKKLKII